MKVDRKRKTDHEDVLYHHKRGLAGDREQSFQEACLLCPCDEAQDHRVLRELIFDLDTLSVSRDGW